MGSSYRLPTQHDSLCWLPVGVNSFESHWKVPSETHSASLIFTHIVVCGGCIQYGYLQHRATHSSFSGCISICMCWTFTLFMLGGKKTQDYSWRSSLSSPPPGERRKTEMKIFLKQCRPLLWPYPVWHTYRTADRISDVFYLIFIVYVLYCVITQPPPALVLVERLIWNVEITDNHSRYHQSSDWSQERCCRYLTLRTGAHERLGLLVIILFVIFLVLTKK